MKTIGIIGGMSWESSQNYYRLINEYVKQQLGGLHSARLILNSVDFAEIAAMQRDGQWQQSGELLADAAKSLKKAGADFLLIATNTMHKVADQITAATSLPLLHIADATGQRLVQDQHKKIALLGTAFTMEEPFYRQRLEDKFNLTVLVPEAAEREKIHRIIFDELCLGKISSESRQFYLDVIDQLTVQGAEAVILGCTEIAMLISNEFTDVPLYDTTDIHARAAVELALKPE